MLVGTSYHSIDNVRFIRIVGTAASGELIRVQRHPPDDGSTAYAPTISNVLFRDVALARTDPPPPGEEPLDRIVVRDWYTTAGGISDVAFENVAVEGPAGGATLRIASDASTPQPIANVRLRGGSLACSSPDQPAIVLNRVEGATFEALEVASTTIDASQPLISIGSLNPCSNVVFSDVAMTGLRAGQVGINFGQAVACGWQRGVMSGDAAAIPAKFGSAAKGCFLTGANLDAIAPDATISPSAEAFQIAENYGSGQRSPICLGVASETTIAANLGMMSSSSVSLVATGGGSLETVDGGVVGDLLILGRKASSALVTAKDRSGSTGNLQLKGNFPLTSPNDTILLQRRSAAEWAELSRGTNG